MSLVTPPPRSTRIAVVWPAGPSGLSVEGGSTPAIHAAATAVSQGPAPSRHAREQKPNVLIKEESSQEEDEVEESGRNAAHEVLVKDDPDRRTSNSARFPRPSYYGDGRDSGGRIRRRRLSSPRPAPVNFSTAASRQPENYETYDIDDDESSELMDAILEDMGRLTVTMKMDDTGRWRILWKPRELDI
ncbi:hypothetical protein PspLS_06638 [Pyricularia sp. CBS 133598]|nr:hypothetical protein PspLS_06638 [Pyricularia sp. CBS 133598]